MTTTPATVITAVGEATKAEQNDSCQLCFLGNNDVVVFNLETWHSVKTNYYGAESPIARSCRDVDDPTPTIWYNFWFL